MTHSLVGMPAPDFDLKDQDGRSVRLSALRGDRVLVVFVPWAFSPVCTYEVEQLRDAKDIHDAVGELLIINCDSMYVNQEWADRNDFTGVMLSDFWPHGATAEAYGVFNADRGLANRGTFLIAPDGTVEWALESPEGSPRDLAAYREALGLPQP